jgi:CBS domain containing-hemolysin-like protein
VTLALLLGVLCLALSAIFSGTETGLYSLERVRLQLRAAEGHSSSRHLLAVVRSPGHAVCTLLLGNTLVNFAVAACGGEVLRACADPGLDDIELELLNTLYLVPLVFVFGELLPKNLFLRHPGALVPVVWPVYRIVEFLLYPLVRPLLLLLRKLDRGTPGGGDSLLRREALAGVLTRDDEAERLSSAQRAIAERILDLRSRRIRELMIPWERVVAVAQGAGQEEILRAGAESGVSRILVRRGEPLGFSGYINVLDAAFTEPGGFRLEDHLHHLPEVSSEAPLTEALGVLQRARRPLAQVRVSGGPPGIVATADIVDLLLGV